MGEQELREALCRKAQEAARQVWQDAEAAVAARRAALETELQARCAAVTAELADITVAVRREVLAAAEAAARRQRLAAETALRERLYGLALRMLPVIDGEARRRLWLALAAELPAADWQRIRVHPADLVLARERFPVAGVTAEAALAGGLIVATADGRIEIDNSLAGRLERGWPELQALLQAACGEEVDNDAAGTAATG